MKIYNLPFGDIRTVAISVSKIVRAVVDSELLVVHVDVGRCVAVGDVIAAISRCAPLDDFGPDHHVAAGQERLLEGDPELPVEVGVDEWIERRVEVSNPEYHGHYHWRAVAEFFSAESCNNVPGIKNPNKYIIYL